MYSMQDVSFIINNVITDITSYFSIIVAYS